jgi:hypothetical protein
MVTIFHIFVGYGPLKEPMVDSLGEMVSVVSKRLSFRGDPLSVNVGVKVPGGKTAC